MPAVAKRQCIASLRELISDFRILPQCGVLEQIQFLNNFLNASGVLLVPTIDEGDLDSPRTVAFASETSALAESEIVALIEEGEGNRIEFKSSFFADTKKLINAPNLPPKEYKSDDVTHSALKTIAAYLNCEGGTLFLGVTDEGNICGIEEDLRLPGLSDEDKWQLTVRSLIETRFKDGKSVNTHISISMHSFKNRRIAILRILPKPITAYLKTANSLYSLYVRNGNRTDQLDITHAEDFFRLKWERSHSLLST